MSILTSTAPSIEAPQSPAPSLRHNFIWTIVGSVVYSACQWGMLSVLTKLGNAVIVGQFALGLAISAPVYWFTNFQLRSVQATDARSEYTFSDYFVLRLFSTLTGFGAIAAIAVISKYDHLTRDVILWVAAAKAIECLGDVVAGLLQKEERLDLVSVSLMVRGFASVLIFSLVFWRTRSVVWAVAGMTLTWLAVLVVCDLRWASRLISDGCGFFLCRRRDLKRLFLLSLPLGTVMTFASLSVNIPRYFLQHYRGSADLGIFASLAYLVVLINLTVYALGQSTTTRMSRMFAEGRVAEFNRLLANLIGVGVTIIVVGIPVALVWGRSVVTLIYRQEYAQHLGLLILLVATSGISAVGTFITCALSAARVFRQQVPVQLTTILGTLATAAIVVPRYGLFGAGLALLASSVVTVVCSSWILRGALLRRPVIQDDPVVNSGCDLA